jgi:rhamnose utilization protein RhaD (predicted bifunctional aldolase and dehydrogenase)
MTNFISSVSAMGGDLIGDVLETSARIGSDPSLVQGAGGNVSVKQGETIWVKASGKWLARATDEPMLVPLDLAYIRRHLADVDDDKQLLAAAQLPFELSLKPSIETTLHVVMEQAVVLHVHCVAAIAQAAQLDARERLAVLLEGLDWAWIPYARPGIPLTRMIEANRRGSENIFVLANHGLVVGAQTAREVEMLLADVGRRLRVMPRRGPPPDLERLGPFVASGAYKLPLYEAVHNLATDPDNLAHASVGSLYPDHVVFLGHGAAILQDGEMPRDAARRVAAPGVPEPALILVPGAGVVMRADVGRNGEEMALCLALVVAQIPPGAALGRLSRGQELELIDWDAEKYRRSLNT